MRSSLIRLTGLFIFSTLICGASFSEPYSTLINSELNNQRKFKVSINKSNNKIASNVKENIKKEKIVNTKNNLIKPIKFQDLKNLIINNNLELKAERAKLDQSKNNLLIVKSESQPSIGITAEGFPQFSIGEGNNPKRETKELKGSLAATLSYKLIDPTKKSKINIAKNQLDKAKITYDILENEILAKAQKLFIELQLSKQKVNIAKNAVNLSESSLEDAKMLNKALIVSDIEVLEAESQLSRDQKYLNEKTNELELSRVFLAEVIGINARRLKKISIDNQLIGAWEMDLKESIKLARDNNANLKQIELDFIIKQNKSDKELGKTRPSFSLVNKLSSSLNQGQSNISNSIDFDETGSDYENTIGIIGKWDIFNGGRNQYIKKIKKEKEKEYKIRIKDKNNKIKLQVKENYAILKTAFKNIFNTSYQVQKNKNILSISRLRFNAGVTSQREIINNQRDLTQSKIVYANAISNYNKSLIELNRFSNINSFKACSNEDNLIFKSNKSNSKLKLKDACNILLYNDFNTSMNSPGFKDYKNNINRFINENEAIMKNKSFNKDPQKVNKSKKEIIIIEQNNNCDNIVNVKLQKICFDSYL